MTGQKQLEVHRHLAIYIHQIFIHDMLPSSAVVIQIVVISSGLSVYSPHIGLLQSFARSLICPRAPQARRTEPRWARSCLWLLERHSFQFRRELEEYEIGSFFATPPEVASFLSSLEKVDVRATQLLCKHPRRLEQLLPQTDLFFFFFFT